MGRRPRDYNPLTEGIGEDIISDEASVKYGKAVRDFLLRLIDMADEEAAEISPVDKERFEGFLKYGSVNELAHRSKLSATTVNSSVGHVVDALEGLIANWENPHRRLVEQQREIAELKKNRGGKYTVEQHQLEAMRLLREENARLKKIVETYEPAPLPKSGLWVQAGDPMRLKLSRKLAQAGLPSLTVTRLESHGIITICDAVRYTESQISKLPGIPLSDVEKVVSRIRYMGLHMGMVVRWDPAIGNYVIQT